MMVIVGQHADIWFLALTYFNNNNNNDKKI